MARRKKGIDHAFLGLVDDFAKAPVNFMTTPLNKTKKGRR